MAIAFVSSGDLGNNGGTTNSLTASYTCVGGSRNLLLVGFMGDQTFYGHDDVTSVTYNGIGMSLAAKSAPAPGGSDVDTRYNYIYYLYLGANAVAAGAHNVIISCTGIHHLIAVAGEWSGVRQSGGADSSNTNRVYNNNVDVLTATTSTTTVARDCWAMLEVHSATESAGTGATLRREGAAFGSPGLFDSASAISPPKSYSMTTTASSPNTQINHTMVSFAPAVSAVVPRRPLRIWKRVS